MSQPRRFCICAKSRWHPAVRREHALTLGLVADGHEVHFVEQPRDIRDPWARSRPPIDLPAGVDVSSPRTLVPGHHDRLAHVAETVTLASHLRRATRSAPPDAVVVNAPWNWVGATRSVPRGTRKVLDIGDDWATLIPAKRTRIMEMYRRISAEADQIIVVTEGLRHLFDRPVVVVPNATATELLVVPVTVAPGKNRMVYVGTLSERFDAQLMTEVLRLLPDWTFDIYGSFQYAGLQDEPSPEMKQLLATPGDRVTWHGIVERSRLAGVLDTGDVLVLPNDVTRSDGQDPMKLYDYAARARPVVATNIRTPASVPRTFAQARTAEEFAHSVRRIASAAPGNRVWAERNSWSSRIPVWVDAVLDGDDGSKS